MKLSTVLDSSILFQHWFLTGPSFELIYRFNELSNSKLIIPSIVIEETTNKYREKLHENYDKSVADLKKLRGLLYHQKLPIVEPHIEIENVSNEYLNYLNARVKDLKIVTPDYNEVPHKVIVQRALAYRKPFQKSGKGYRDSLIWEVILQQIANKDNKTIYVTNNTNDFGDKDGALHMHLRDDLLALGRSLQP